MFKKLLLLISMALGMSVPLLHDYVSPAAGISAVVGCIFALCYALFAYLDGGFSK